jgi:hypothetical protein
MIALLLTLSLGQPARAGMVTDFCAKHLTWLIGDDPWPYAEYDAESLFVDFVWSRDPAIALELSYRFRHGMLTDEQAARARRWGIVYDAAKN